MESMGAFVKSSGTSGKAVKACVRGLLIFLKGTLRYNVSPKQLGNDLDLLGLASEKGYNLKNLGTKLRELVPRSNYENADDE